MSQTSGRMRSARFFVLVADLRVVDGVVKVEGGGQGLLVLGQGVVHDPEALGIEQVGHADAAASDLVFVARPDAARSGADGDAVLARFRHLFHQPVKRKNHVRAIADAQLASDVDAGGFQHADLVQQGGQIDHHAVADDGLDSGPQDSARNQLQNELLFPDKNRVAGVMATLIARHDVEALGKQVDYFAFAFVAPLRAENDDILHLV